MKASDILAIIKKFASDVIRIIKEAVKLPYAKLYLLLSILFIVPFTFITFPFNLFIKDKLRDMEKNIGAAITTGDIGVHFVGDSEIEKFHMQFRDGSELLLDNIILDINTFGLVIDLIFTDDIHVNGSVSAKYLKYSSQTYNYTGSLNGNIDLNLSLSPLKLKYGSVNMLAQNSSIQLESFTLPESLGGLPVELPNVRCPSISIDSSFDEKVIQIKKIGISGSDIRATIAGSINRSIVFNNSSMNINCSIDEDSSILSKYKILFLKSINNKKLDLRIKGTIRQPIIEFSK